MIEIYKFCEFVASIDKHISSDIDVKNLMMKTITRI
jgi:hypothetical protein